MRTVTFYSYKGGVGRTLALVNTARELAKIGKTVFVLDLDLEAPGLHFKLLDDTGRDWIRGGFVEFARQFLAENVPPPLHDYISLCEPREGEKGPVFLMPAGRSTAETYWRELTKLHWQELIYGTGAEPGETEVKPGRGVELFYHLKATIEQEFFPDYLLIDARTGITEVGGAAVTLLADVVICLFANNRESLWGTREVVRSIQRVSAKRPADVPPIDVVLALARFPEGEKYAQKESDLRGSLLRHLSEPLPGELPPNIKPLVVLHSDRPLEAKEEILAETPGSEGRTLAKDYRDLFDALGLGAQIQELRLRSHMEEADRLERLPGKFDEAIKNRLQAVRLTAELFGRAHERYFQELHKVAEALDNALHPELQVEAVHLLEARSLEAEEPADDPGTSAARIEAAASSALLMVRLARYLPALAELRRAVRLAARFEELARVADLAANLQFRYRKGSGKDDLTYPHLLLESARLLRRLNDGGSMIQVEEILREAIARAASWRSEGEQVMDDSRRELSDLLEKQGRKEEARKERRAIGRSAPRLLAAPAREAMPPKRHLRTQRGGVEMETFTIPLRVVTPILGGAAVPRTIDEVDRLRVPSIRGQLRFWWRALFGTLVRPSLYDAEQRLLGGVGGETAIRSAVELRVEIVEQGELDRSNVRPETLGAYALWPAREARGEKPMDVAPRRKEGTRFTLEVRCPKSEAPAVRATLKAWILFGGYGGRTRRGVGSLAIDSPGQRSEWLPAAATREALKDLFGRDVFAPVPGRAPDDLPLFAGASLRVGGAGSDPLPAWIEALGWLKEFRQGQPDSGKIGFHDPKHARERGTFQRPGRSNWPEADKVRRLSGAGPWAHDPNHNPTPVWPRAGFGLPIVSQFQGKERPGTPPYRYRDPAKYEIRWRLAKRNKDGKEAHEYHDRLASPLIVKPMQLANGQFVPCALWLFRGFPAHGQVVLKENDSRTHRSAADFDRLVAVGDTARFAPLAIGDREPQAGLRLRKAFFEWMKRRPNVQVVVP